MTWGIGKLSPNQSKVQKFYFDGLFLSKVYEVWAGTIQQSYLYDTEQWCKIGIILDLVVSKMTWGIRWTFIRTSKNLKNCTLMGSFFSKHIMFQFRKFQRNYVSSHWWLLQNLKENWLVTWKITLRTWLVSIPAVESLKICTLIRYFCLKHTNT